MKTRIVKVLFFTTILSLLSSCGGGPDTTDWPHIEFDFEASDISKICVDYTHHNVGGYKDKEESGYLILRDTEDLVTFFLYTKEFPLKSAPESYLDISNFRERILVTFYYWKADEIFTTNLRFYSYNMFESKVMLNNGDVHFIPWEVKHLYKKFCNV